MSSTTASLPVYLLPGVSVFQPTHLEGDANFATEILPGPPPISTIQNPIVKRDPKKPALVYSYLPASDPGTSYSGIMHGTLIGQDAYKRSAKSSNNLAVGRAQRAEARSQNTANSSNPPDAASTSTSTTNGAPQPLPSTTDTDTDVQMLDPPFLSRSASVQDLEEPKSDTSGRPRRKDKGKAREVEPAVRFKDDPKAHNQVVAEPNPNLLNNNDHCSSCRSQGALVYCDGCPRAFHLACLDPPIESIDEGDSHWFCPACMIVQSPPAPKKRRPTMLEPVMQALENSIPMEFQLPDDIRTFFKDVGTGPRGAYVDTSEIKPPRLNRHGQLEDRDAHRLRDRNGQPVLCFRCGTSALPETIAATASSTKRVRKATPKAMQYEAWKDIISCDYCDLHWHLDCLDPPLSSMPAFTKKWMCPNHSEKIIPPKRRIPKQQAAPIEVTKPSQWNNGNIEVLESDISPAVESQQRVTVDEVLINGRRYRVPERIILLDFWNKVSKNPTSGQNSDDSSGMSSPLTSLSSLEEDETAPLLPSTSAHDLQAAQLLFDFQKGNSPARAPLTINGNTKVNGTTIKKEPVANPPFPPADTIPAKTSRATRTAPKRSAAAKSSVDVIASDSRPATAPPAKRRRSNVVAPPAPTRALRSRSKNIEKTRRIDDVDELSTPPAPTPSASRQKARVNVKTEETDVNLSFFDEAATTDSVSAPLPARKPAKRIRTSRKKDPEESADQKLKEKKIRKRKDEDAYIDTNRIKSKTPKSSQRAPPPPSTTSLSSLSTVNITPTTTATSTPATPSLKIRLPRLTLLGSPAVTTTPKPTAGTSSTRTS